MTSIYVHYDASQADDKEKHAESEKRSPSSQAELSHHGISNPNQYAMAPSTYPYHDPYYKSIFAPYDGQPYPPQPFGGQPTVHLQLMGIQQAGVPLPSDAVEEPVFVNAKQYHGIMRRRHSRAKAESENKLLKSRKPYLHESRHLHALSRVRGCGGRFLKAKENENQSNEVTSQDESQTNLNLNNNTQSCFLGQCPSKLKAVQLSTQISTMTMKLKVGIASSKI